MTSVAEKDRKFWNKLADRYSRRPVADEETYQHKLRLTQAFLEPHMEVLEFGCGTGSTAIAHAPYAQHILATDLSDNMLQIGREKAAAAGVINVSFERASIEEFDAQGKSFDMVLGLNILHLCRDPEAVMAKVHDLLKPGGFFVQSTACLKDMGMVQLALPIMQAIGKAPFIAKFTADELREMLDRTGFHIIEEHYPGGMAADFIISRRAPD